MNASGGAASGSNRVNRGGSWNNNANNCTVSNRNYNDPNNRNTDCETRSNLLNYSYGILGFLVMTI